MTDKPENPAAFPCTGEGFDSPKYTQHGMTLRDYFAGQVASGMAAYNASPIMPEIADTRAAINARAYNGPEGTKYDRKLAEALKRMTDDEGKAYRDVVNAVHDALYAVPKGGAYGDSVQGNGAAIDTIFRHETGVDVHVQLFVTPLKEAKS